MFYISKLKLQTPTSKSEKKNVCAADFTIDSLDFGSRNVFVSFGVIFAFILSEIDYNIKDRENHYKIIESYLFYHINQFKNYQKGFSENVFVDLFKSKFFNYYSSDLFYFANKFIIKFFAKSQNYNYQLNFRSYLHIICICRCTLMNF